MSRPRQLAIIADDLTSATDCGVSLAKTGFTTYVILKDGALPLECRKAQVVSFDTDSRSALPDDAYSIVREVASQVKAQHYRYVFKSVDSTLRGNIVPEIDAMMDASEFDCAAIAPAFPFYGRTTVNGIHFLNGVPLVRTEFANDLMSPVSEADIPKLLATQSKREVALISLGILHQGTSAIVREVTSRCSEGKELLVFDAEKEDDLRVIIDAVKAADRNTLWVGSTGLSRYLSNLLQAPENLPRKRHAANRRKVMIVSGSVSEVTREQVAVLRASQGVVNAEVNSIDIVKGEDFATEEINRCSSLLSEGLETGDLVMLHVGSSREAVTQTKAEGRAAGLREHEYSARILSALAAVTRRMVDAFALRGVILVGGDTSEAVCRGLNIQAIELLDEVEPGIPIGQLVGTNMLIVTKAGGFGSPKSLANCLSALMSF